MFEKIQDFVKIALERTWLTSGYWLIHYSRCDFTQMSWVSVTIILNAGLFSKNTKLVSFWSIFTVQWTLQIWDQSISDQIFPYLTQTRLNDDFLISIFDIFGSYLAYKLWKFGLISWLFLRKCAWKLYKTRLIPWKTPKPGVKRFQTTKFSYFDQKNSISNVTY